MHIKELDLTDLNELQKVSTETFYDTFAAQNTEQNMQDYLVNSSSWKSYPQNSKIKIHFFISYSMTRMKLWVISS